MKQTKFVSGLFFALFLRVGLFSQVSQNWDTDGNPNIPVNSFIGTTDQKPLKLATDAQTRIFIDEIGNVGIGVNSPTYKLHIAGDIKTSGGIFTEDMSKFSGHAAFYQGITLDNLQSQDPEPRLIAIRMSGEVVDALSTEVQAHIIRVDSALHIGDSSLVLLGQTSNGPYHIYTTNGPLKINGIGSSNTFINPTAGAVGIGTASVTAGVKLKVSGQTNFQGNVGIWTMPDPNSALSLLGQNRTPLSIEAQHSAGFGYGILQRVTQNQTKALGVINANTNQELLVLYGDGSIQSGNTGYSPNAQINVKTSKDVALKIEPGNQATSYGIQIIATAGRAIAVQDPVTNEDVFRVSSSGVIQTQGLRVRMAPFPDYVFEEGYELLPLPELEKYIEENGKLPGMPTEGEIQAEGADLADLCRLQQEKIEELTLHLIEINKRLNEMEKGGQ